MPDGAVVRVYPHLERWWDELADGLRSVHTFDELWAAACREMSAKEYADMGEEEIAERILATVKEVWNG